MNSFGSRSKLRVGNQEYEIYRLDALEKQDCSPQRLPFSLKILLENLLRTENGRSVPRTMCAFWPGGSRKPFPTRRLPSPRRACSCRISPVFPQWSTWVRCVTP